MHLKYGGYNCAISIQTFVFQAEQDTWKERYLQNSSVKKIQQESGLLSKMKKGIKIKSVGKSNF